MGYISDDTRKVTTHRLIEMKQRGEKISMLTSYDYTMAQIVDGAGVDVILVGDSASNVMAGNVTTLPITLDQMIYHGKSVVRGVKRAMVIVDMPFGSYQGNELEGLASAIRIMKESHADALKLEGGEEIIGTVKRILSAGIPIMGHLGLMPQSINKYGTYTRCAFAGRSRMLRTGIGEDSCRIGCPRGKRADYTRYRHRCRWRCGRPGVGGSGYAGYE